MKKRVELYLHDPKLPGALREQKNLYNRLKRKDPSNLTPSDIELLSLLTASLTKHNYLSLQTSPDLASGKPLLVRQKQLRRRYNEIKLQIKSSLSEQETTQLTDELALIEEKLVRMRPQPLPKKPNKGNKIPIPQKYITERNEKIRNAHKVSGFNSLRARIVQGGKADGKK